MEQENKKWGDMSKDPGLERSLGGLCNILFPKQYKKQGKAEGSDSSDQPSNFA